MSYTMIDLIAFLCLIVLLKLAIQNINILIVYYNSSK